MIGFYGYVRVSTAKQGTHGVSLTEQRGAIQRYADQHGLQILSWYEEKETAAKRGRPVFSEMLESLRGGGAKGVIIHKIDRSARNLRDWADLGELIDAGIVVHFANESLDLQSRGGRLSADIQAVVAADYIRNLREETKKGIYGRLKQGFYPMPAPLGYLDRGKAQAKVRDPRTAPHVVAAFELYASGQYNLRTLGQELHRRGLRNRAGGRVTKNGLSVLLNNPFYIGLIRIRATGKTFEGAHEPLVSKALYDHVQAILQGKAVSSRRSVHNFVFRRLLACSHCRYSLIGERQKGRVYYRCHTTECPTTSIREDAVDSRFETRFTPLHFDEGDLLHLADHLDKLRKDAHQSLGVRVENMRLRLSQNEARLERLTDALLDGLISTEIFEQRKTALLHERVSLQEVLSAAPTQPDAAAGQVWGIIELAGRAYASYKGGAPGEKRRLVEILTSNRLVAHRTLDFSMSPPFDGVARALKRAGGDPQRDRARTISRLLSRIWAFAESGRLNGLFDTNTHQATTPSEDDIGVELSA